MVLSLADIGALIDREEALEADFVHLTSNETLLSPFAQRVLSSSLGNRYLLEHGDVRQDSPSRLNAFLFRGLDHVNAIERSALEVCKELFGADQVELRCLSGLHAMQTTMCALTEPGDTVMRFGVADGGHFATEHIIKQFGRRSCCYAFDRDHLTIDLAATAEVLARERPKLLYLDAMNYLFPFPIRELREIVGKTPILYDGSHTLGLIAGGQFQNPLDEGADILQANTHKTFFGPQKGIVLSRNRELMERVSYALTQGLVSSQHTASLLALCIALHEMRLHGKAYARAVVDHAAYLAQRCAEEGLPVLTRKDGVATANHHFYVDLTGIASASHAMERLLRARIAVHRVIPFRNVDGLRLGVQETTRRGYGLGDYDQLARWIGDVVLRGQDPETLAPAVTAMARSKRAVLYCGDLPETKTIQEPAPMGYMDRGPRIHIARWVDVKRVGDGFQLNGENYAVARELGALAGASPNQTDATGNISVRGREGIFVTAAGAYIKGLQPGNFVRLDGVRGGVLDYAGDGMPSSESLMHWLIYQQTDAGAVAHTHCLLTNAEAQDLDVAIIPPQEYGSVALARHVAEACRRRPLVYVQRHGLVFWGRDAERCLDALRGFIDYHREKAHG